ncbi:MAG: glycosyltransferase [Leptolyngbyaceae cyanobacterium RM1_1_2]|nr:glycosyltransferase [Leptolyngbyaceae cyanobacterium RM1_1_2]
MQTVAPVGRSCCKNVLKEEVHAYFERIAPEIDRWSDRSRYYYRDITRLHQFVIPPHQRVLEIGSGTGDLLAAVAPAVGVGIDFSATMVALAQQKHPHLRFYCLDVETITPDAIGDRPQTFDYIILSGVTGFLSDIQAALVRLRPFCHRRTRVILTFHNFLWEPMLKLAEAIGQRRPQPPYSWLSMDDVANLLLITGYQSLKRGRRLLLPKQVPGLSNLLNRYLAPLPFFKHFCLTNYIVAKVQPVPVQTPLTCSVIVPARNEAGNIADAIARMPQLGSKTEVIFVEGHSRDQTWQTIQDVSSAYCGPLTLKAFQQAGKGKADAVRLGFTAATGDILMILDADLSVPPEDLPHFFDVIASGQGEFINGCRLVYPRSRRAMPFLNTLANKIFALLFSFLLDQPLKDTLCGTKVLWRTDYQRIAAGRRYFGDFDPFGDFDLLFGAAKLNLQTVEVPIRYQDRYYGASNIAHFREGLVLLRMCAYASRKLKFVR